MNSATHPQSVAIAINGVGQVSGLFQTARQGRAVCVLAHGAGAGMTHPFMMAVADGLGQHGISTLRYQFPYMEKRSSRPDTPRIAHAAVRAAVAEASRLAPGLPLFAGGKSFGGRMTSQAQAESPLPGVSGLVFFGFPLHPPGRGSTDRAKHLAEVHIPMLFLQGSRDEFAQLELLHPMIQQLGGRAMLKLFEGANHSFHVPARTGHTDSEVRTEMLAAVAEWIAGVTHHTKQGKH